MGSQKHLHIFNVHMSDSLNSVKGLLYGLLKGMPGMQAMAQMFVPQKEPGDMPCSVAVEHDRSGWG